CYRAIFESLASERELLLVGRISSFLIGAVIIGGAVAIPYVGGAEEVILTITSLLVVPMVLPTIWGLIFGKITQKAVWYATGLSFLAAFFTTVGIPQASDVAVLVWLSENSLVAEVGVGVIVPLAVLALFERFGQR